MTWIEFSQAAANGNGTYNWNTTGVAPGTYYIGGYLYVGRQADLLPPHPVDHHPGRRRRRPSP